MNWHNLKSNLEIPMTKEITSVIRSFILLLLSKKFLCSKNEILIATPTHPQVFISICAMPFIKKVVTFGGTFAIRMYRHIPICCTLSFIN